MIRVSHSYSLTCLKYPPAASNSWNYFCHEGNQTNVRWSGFWSLLSPDVAGAIDTTQISPDVLTSSVDLFFTFCTVFVPNGSYLLETFIRVTC
jgi:hypothetical protein